MESSHLPSGEPASKIVLDGHHRITAGGWSYRTNRRGWIIYRDPKTGSWHTRAEALAIVDP